MPSDQHASAWPVDTMLVFSSSSTPGALGNTGVAAGGTPEIFVRPFPVANAGGVVKVSSGGGGSARWSGDGRTIYYVAFDLKTVRAVHVTIGSAVSVGATETVMTVPGAWQWVGRELEDREDPCDAGGRGRSRAYRRDSALARRFPAQPGREAMTPSSAIQSRDDAY